MVDPTQSLSGRSLRRCRRTCRGGRPLRRSRAAPERMRRRALTEGECRSRSRARGERRGCWRSMSGLRWRAGMTIFCCCTRGDMTDGSGDCDGKVHGTARSRVRLEGSSYSMCCQEQNSRGWWPCMERTGVCHASARAGLTSWTSKQTGKCPGRSGTPLVRSHAGTMRRG